MSGKGYIGKISAIVTVNTADASRAFNKSADEAQNYGKRLESSIRTASNNASKSFEGMFSQFERLQRTFRAAQSANFSLPVNPKALEQLTLAARQLADPLTAATKQFDGLAFAVQRQFSPALTAVKADVLSLRDTLQAGGTVGREVFSELAGDVSQVAGSIGRLNETASITKKLLTGQELSFVRPDVVDTLNAAVAAQQRLASASSSVRGSPIARDLIEDASILQDQINKISARIERLNSEGLDITVSQAGLDLALRRLRDVAQLTNQISAAPSAAQPGGDDTDRIIARARAEREFYGESTRLANQAAADAAAPLIARARAEREFYEESERLANQAASDAAAPLIARARAEREFYDESRRLREAAAADAAEFATIGRSSNVADGQANQRRIAASTAVGLDERGPTEVPRELDAVQSRIQSLRGQIESLPAALQGGLTQELRAIQREFVGVADSVRPSVEQVSRLESEIQRVSSLASQSRLAANFAQSFGGAGTAGVEAGLNSLALSGYTAQLQVIQQAIGRASAEARGPAVQAFNALRNAIAEAMANGTIQTRATQASIEQLTREAVTAAARVADIGEGGLSRQVRRVGDVARGSFGNAGLAIQQAAFAFDDFFSVTGDFDQRIRAAGNNLSQLGFILGSTTGLFIGIGIAAGAQAAAGIIKFINNGQKAEDQTKALNDSLARQKSLTEELAESFRSLADEISRLTFSGPAQQARAFQQQLDDIRRKQREDRDSRVANLDPQVLAARARRNQIDRELGENADPGVAARLIRDRQDAVRREREAVAAANRPLGRGDEILDIVTRARLREVARTDVSGSPRDEEARRRREAARRQAAIDVPLGQDVESRGAQRRAVQARIEELRPNVRPRNFLLENLPFTGRVGAETDRRIFTDLERTLARLDNELRGALDELSVQIVEKSQAAALAIESAQEDVADAIRRGVVGAAEFQAALDNTAKQLSDAQSQLQRAREDETLTPEQREAAVRQAEGRVRDIENRRDAINERSREIRLGRTVGGERATSALSSLQGNERFANEYAGLTARLASAVDAEMQARREYEQALATGTDAEQEGARQRLAAAQQVSESAAAMAEAMLSAESAIKRLRDLLSGSLSASERLADDAQKRLTSAPTDENRRARDDAERQLISDRRRVAEANNALDFRRSEASRTDPLLRVIDSELEGIIQERRRLEAEAKLNNQELDPAESRKLADREARLQAEREERLLELTQAEREQADAIAWEIDARRRLIEQIEKERQFDEQVRNRQNPVGEASRGLDLLGTSAERAARNVEQQVADITSAFDEQLRGLFDATGGLPNAGILDQAEGLRKEFSDGLNAIFSDAARSAAPAIAELFDSVQNAVAQGPSRAALNVADVSTSEGSRELTRLLRGDDAARNVNIAQLERQNQSLLTLIGVMTKVEQKMGMTIDLK